MIEPIRKSIEVPGDPEAAFRTFAQAIALWWPLETHSVSAGTRGRPARDVAIEPRLGGRIYETTPEGECVTWGTVRAYQPGREIVF